MHLIPECEPLISICIPAYDMGGKGAIFLDSTLATVAAQDYRNYEVIVADQARGGFLNDVCKKWSAHFDLVRVETSHLIGRSSVNCNAAMRAARGNIIKILFQDDLLCKTNALSMIVEAFMSQKRRWLLCGAGQTEDGTTVKRSMIPYMHAQIRFGKNTVSSPSVLAFEAGHGLMFDENLVWLMDVEFYHRIACQFSDPAILKDTLVLNREHESQVSNNLSLKVKKDELRYVRNKFLSSETLSDFYEYCRQSLKLFRKGLF